MFIKYDIRGKYPSEVNESLAQFLSEKFVNYLKSKRFNEIFIGQDIRKSSTSLLNSCVNVFSQANLKINYLGIIPSPLFYYFCLKNKKPGVIITASHLPLSYNGFKFFLPNNKIWIYKNITKVKKTTINNKKILSSQLKEEIYLNYLNNLKKLIKIENNHSFYYSPQRRSANNYLFNLLPKVFKNIKIKKESEIFVSSDYDGDRIFIKYKNRFLSPEYLLYLILKISNYKKIGLPITIHKNIKKNFPQRKFFLIKTGHSNFKNAYKKYNLDFGLEPSYHFYFFKEMQTEAPIFTLLKLFKFIDNNDLNKLFTIPFPLYRFDIQDKIKVRKLLKYAKINNFKLKKFDGLYFYKKFNREDYLAFNLRQSQTEKNTYRIFIESNKWSLLRNFCNNFKK